VFVSSALHELAAERKAAREAIAQLRLTPVMFELGARPYPPRELYRAYLAQSDIFVGLYAERYGWVAPGMDVSGLEDEYRLAATQPKLIYVKVPAPEREPGLQALLDFIRDDGVSFRAFATPDELRGLIVDDLALLLTERFMAQSEKPPADRPATLPAPRGPLIDRDREVVAVQKFLQREDVGVVTLTGPGGVGKTRLAVQVAAALSAHFADGVTFVPMAAVIDPAEIVPTVSRALGVAGSGRRSVEESVLDYLRPRQLLLVLDNVEQVVAAAPLATQALDAAPRLKILATSREPLHVRGEHVVHVAPLAVPDPQHLSGLDELAEVPAVALFLARAREARPDFALTVENAAAVVAICRRLDGLPLALELAAARLTVLTPQSLLQRLERRLPLLTHGARDLPPRQQTLRDTISWSYDLLREGDKRLFRRLAIFNGDFTLEAAQAVSADDDTPALPDANGDIVLEGIASLVDKSLVVPDRTGDGQPRFRLLQTIREYAQERLRDGGELAALQRRHAVFFLSLAETVEPHLYLPERDAWLARLECAHDDLRAALAWSTTDKETRDAPGKSERSLTESLENSEIGLRLAGALAWYWLLRGRLQEGRGWLDQMLARADGGDKSMARGKALDGAGLLALAQGDVDFARVRAEESVATFRALGDRQWLANALLLLGIIRIAQDDAATALTLLEESRTQHEAAGRPLGITFDAYLTYYLGRAAHASGDLATAQSRYEHSLALFRTIGDAVGRALALDALALMAAARGDDATAQALFAQSLPLVRTSGDRYDLAHLLIDAGTTALQRGDQARAQSLLIEGLHLWSDIGPRTGIARALAGLGGVAAATGQAERAGRLFGAASALFSPTARLLRDTGSTDIERSIAEARARLDAAAFAAGWAAGQTMTEEQAIADATSAIALAADTGQRVSPLSVSPP
jgi:predicted ATPase